MGKLTDALRADVVTHGPLCSVESLRRQLSPEDRAELDAALASSVTATSLSRSIKVAYGEHVAEETLQRHRRKVCRCAPS